jgi:predicted kinase
MWYDGYFNQAELQGAFMTCERQKPTLILMAGLPGAGKTTLAHALGSALRWLVLDKDMHKSLFATIGMTDTLASAMAYELLFEVAQDILARQRLSVIFDSAAQHPFILNHAIAITHRANARLKVILCSVSSEERYSRLSRRSTSFSSLYRETLAVEDDLCLFAHLPAHRLVMQTTRPLEECVALALSYIEQ